MKAGDEYDVLSIVVRRDGKILSRWFRGCCTRRQDIRGDRDSY
jgi:hypothetical protein